MTAEVELPVGWDVLQWRLDELTLAGWPMLVAMRLAETPSVDLHLACELLEKGCPPELALKIIY